VTVHIKVKQTHYTHMEAQGERRYSSYSFTTSALDGVSGQRHAPSTLYPRGRPTAPIEQEAGWARAGLDAEARGNPLCLCRGSNLDHPVAQSIIRHCTDWATPVPVSFTYFQ
jgi:hypothetical protein